MAKVGVVIVTYNNADMLRSLLVELANQTLKPNEIIVIDNASDDNTKEIVNGMSGLARYARLESNMGSAGGYCEGVKVACENNDLIWLLDDDVSVKADALEMLLKWQDYIRLGAIRSCAGQLPGSLPIRTKGFAWRGTMISRELINDIGLPRQEYFLYAEDVEYSMRMNKHGYVIFWAPKSIVIERRSTDKIKFSVGGIKGIIYEDAFRIYYAHRNQVNVYLEYRDYYNLAMVFAYAMKAILLFGFCGRSKYKGQIRAVFRGIWDGLRGNLGRNNDFLP
ncbi:MAG: glycosyltransferase [Candidatus Omnitrophota bacterium]|nr:glycosyltransferase [Candidatus Omnitrophota bacterium]MBU1928487.1 glycosyltransferase [Candidatus Omnitrophota bacterium]MBU2035440.1 glycosyltransferase [Candidatus Omnitrophota bacterium]MBU2221322.1 glycosyltransferase [Candidatus Omnitrophota bacterium]MBU2257955.1 glycosyltransferase [Candidatus Omnitrophota bacterium]